MHYLFEKQNSLDTPMEIFVFDASREVFPVKPHWHYFAELIYMIRGSAEIECDGRTEIANEGELMLLHPSAVHSIFSADGKPPVYAVFKLHLRHFPSHSSYAPSLTDIYRFARAEGMPVHFDAAASEKLHCGEIFTDCTDEMQARRYGMDMMVRAQIYRLLFGIVRLWIDAGLCIDRCPVTAADDHSIENITEYIDAHIEESIKVSDIAAQCHMSYSGFAAKFHEMYGVSCKEYIERMRIYKAEEYLLFTDHDLSFISQQTGFSDCSHFIRSFRRHRGITPKQYRVRKSQTDL